MNLEAETLSKTLRRLQLIVLTLTAGVVTFFVVAFVLTNRDPGPEQWAFTKILLAVQAALGVSLVVAFPLVRRVSLAAFNRVQADDPAPDELVRRFSLLTLVGAAMAEGFCLTSIIFFLVTGNPLMLLGLGIGLASLFQFFPTEARWSRFVAVRRGRLRARAELARQRPPPPAG